MEKQNDVCIYNDIINGPLNIQHSGKGSVIVRDCVIKGSIILYSESNNIISGCHITPTDGAGITIAPGSGDYKKVSKKKTEDCTIDELFFAIKMKLKK